MKRIPVVPTVIVLLAVAYMIHLGFWQLDRLRQKEAILARYEVALANPQYGTDLDTAQLIDGPGPFTHIRVTCRSAKIGQIKSGRNASSEAGWAHHFTCEYREPLGRSASVSVVGGWSSSPAPVAWSGGEVIGLVVPESATERWKWHVVADPPLAGLEPNAKPDPADIPNNHLAYAVQWFLFAGIALVIYALALRKRLHERAPRQDGLQ